MPQNQRNLSECDGNRLLRGKVEEKIDLISDSKIRNSEKTIMWRQTRSRSAGKRTEKYSFWYQI